MSYTMPACALFELLDAAVVCMIQMMSIPWFTCTILTSIRPTDGAHYMYTRDTFTLGSAAPPHAYTNILCLLAAK